MLFETDSMKTSASHFQRHKSTRHVTSTVVAIDTFRLDLLPSGTTILVGHLVDSGSEYDGNDSAELNEDVE